MLFALSLVLVVVTISTISTTTTMTAYATSEWVDSDEIKDTIKAKNDDGRQAIADADCGPVSGIVHRDVNQDCDALAANRDITEQETTDGEEEPSAPETCEECFKTHLTIEQLLRVMDAFDQETLAGLCANVAANTEETARIILVNVAVPEATVDALIQCLKDVGVVFL